VTSHLQIPFSIQQTKSNYKMVDEVVTTYFKVQPEIFVGGPRRVIPVTQDRNQR